MEAKSAAAIPSKNFKYSLCSDMPLIMPSRPKSSTAPEAALRAHTVYLERSVRRVLQLATPSVFGNRLWHSSSDSAKNSSAKAAWAPDRSLQTCAVGGRRWKQKDHVHQSARRRAWEELHPHLGESCPQ